MQCPGCRSDQTQRLEVIYEGGTQDVSATSYTGGIGGALGAKIGLGGAVTATSGQSQSKLAQRVAPPAKKSLKWPLIMLFLGSGPIMAVVSDVTHSRAIGTLVALAISVGWIVMTLKFNSKDWPALYREWSLQWYCNKCGTVFKPE